MKLKDALNNYYELDKQCGDIEEQWEKDPENIFLEKAFDKAYEKQYAAFERAQNALIDFMQGKIDNITARAMIIGQRDKLMDIVSRIKD